MNLPFISYDILTSSLYFILPNNRLNHTSVHLQISVDDSIYQTFYGTYLILDFKELVLKYC